MTKLEFVLVILVLTILATIIGFRFYWFDGPTETKQGSFPRDMLEAVDRIEWFQRTAQGLNEKQANIELCIERTRAMDEKYGEQDRQFWKSEDREQFNAWSLQVAGLKATYNPTANDYNTLMEKFIRTVDMNGVPDPKRVGHSLPPKFKIFRE